jgi:hydroxymethylglutaryl-CoA reductase
LGHVHFNYNGDSQKLKDYFPHLKRHLLEEVEDLTANMRKRGGGVLDVELIDFSDKLENYYQLKVTFETCDSMGANFINSVLESFSQTLMTSIQQSSLFEDSEKDVQIVMSILSNFTDECLVRVSVSCPVEELGEVNGFAAEVFANKFKQAVDIACIDPYRATTHNKGIMNGIDAVIIATGNDFRAIEACLHTYAAAEGRYKSLSQCSIVDGIFTFEMTLPLALGTVGGLTSLHPLAKRSLELLGKPTAAELMQIVAATGLAQNFAAVKSLVTTGIQAGHMKMHLNNILANLQADEKESESVREYFSDKVVSFSSVRDFLHQLRDSIGPERSIQ